MTELQRKIAEASAKIKSFLSLYRVVGLVIFLMLVGALVVFSQPKKINESLVINTALLKQTSAIVAGGSPVKWSVLVRRDDIAQDNYLVKLPKQAKNIKTATITTGEARKILTTSKQLTTPLESRVALALARPNGNGSQLIKTSSSLLADADEAVSAIIEAVASSPAPEATVVDVSTQADNQTPLVNESVPAVVPVVEAPVVATSSDRQTASSAGPRYAEGSGEASSFGEPKSGRATPESLTEAGVGQSVPTVVPTVTAPILENENSSSTSGVGQSEDFVKIDFETPAPVIEEVKTSRGKLVTISSVENISGSSTEQLPLTDVLASTKIPPIYSVGEENKIHIKWKNNNNQNMSFHAYDTDSDGMLDYVEWTVPHLSEQIFEIIFISKAFLLDSERHVIGDIYDETSALADDKFASVSNVQYVRATFNSILDNTKDITVYARTKCPTSDVGQTAGECPTSDVGQLGASIEVYPVYTDSDGNQLQGPKLDLVADGINPDFSSIYPLGNASSTTGVGPFVKYRVLLKKLIQPTDVFDLKVISPSPSLGTISTGVEIDYIVDPTPAAYYWTGASGASTNVATNWTTTVNGACGVSTGGNVPTTGDTVVFSSGCTNNAVIGASWSLATLTLGAGYSGTVTASTTGIASTTITGDLTVASGTLAIGANDLAVAGNSTVTGTLTIGASVGNGWTTGNLTIGAGGTASSTAAGTIYYNQVTVSGTLSPDASGTYTVKGMYLGYPYYQRGTDSYYVQMYSGGWYNVATNQPFSGTPNWYHNPTGEKYIVPGNYSPESGATGNAGVANVTASGEYTRLNNSKITIAGNFDQSNTSSKFLAWSSLITVNGNGTFTASGSLGQGQYNNATLVLNGTNTLAYYNIVSSQNDGFLNLIAGQNGKTTTIATNIGVGNKTTIGSGTLTGTNSYILFTRSVNPFSFDANSHISVPRISFFGSGTNLTIPASPNGYDSDLEVYYNALITQTGDVVVNYPHSLNVGRITDGTSGSRWKTSGYNLSVGGDLTIGANLSSASMILDSTSDATSTRNSTITVGGNWLNYGNGSAPSTFIAASSTVIFNATSTTRTITNGSTTSPFYNLTINGSGSTFTLADNASVAGALTVTAGTLAIGANNLAVTGSSTITSALTLTNSSSTGWTTGDLNLGASGTITSNATTYYNQVTVSGTLSPDVTGTYTVAGVYNGLPYYRRGTDSYYIWRYLGSGGIWIIGPNPGGTSGNLFNNFTTSLAGSYNPIVPSTGTATVANVTASGIYYGATSDITISGNYTQTAGGYFNAGSSLITQNGNGNFTADGSGNSGAYSTQFNSASLVLNGNNTLTYNNLTTVYHNGFANFTAGQNGNTTTLNINGSMSVKTSLTIGTGTLTSSGIGNIYFGEVGNSSLNVNAANSVISITSLLFYGNGTQTIPSLTKGYDCNINLSNTATIVSQNGDIILNSGKDLKIYGDGYTGAINTWLTNGYNLTVGGNLQIGAGSDSGRKILDATSGATSTRNSTITVAGNWTNFGNGTAGKESKFIAASSTVVLTGTWSGGTVTSGALNSPFYNLTQNGVNGTYTLQDALVVSHNLTLTNGTLDTKSGSNYAVTIGSANPINGDFTQSTTAKFLARTSTITLNGNGNFNADGTLDETQFNTVSLILNGTNTLTYNHLPTFYQNGFKNLTVGQSGGTTTLVTTNSAYGLAVRSVLAIGSGSLTGSGVANTLSNGDLWLVGSNPLSFDANSRISVPNLRFWNTATIPSLTNGYDCNIVVDYNSGVTQTGNVVLNGTKSLFVSGENAPARTPSWNTAGYNLSVGGNIQIGANGGGDTGLKTLNATGAGGRNSTITVGGDWLNYGTGSASSTFVADNSTVIFNKTSGTQNLTSGGSSFYNLTHSGAGTLKLLANALTVTHDLTNSGGTLDSNGQTINVAGTWSNTASFLHGSSTVNFTGTDQGIFGTSTFYNLTKTVTTAATLTFEAAKTQVIAGVLTLQGALNQLLSLVSSVAGTAFSLNPLNISTLNFLSVQDFTNASSTPLILTNSRNISGTTNLVFGPTTVTWTGTTNTNWSVGTNWDVGYVPNATDNVIIANTANQPVLSTSTSANTITVNSGATLAVGTYNLAITGTSTINGTLTIGNSAGTGWTTTNLIIGANGTASSTANGTIYYNQVTVTGTLSPDATGVYTVVGMYNGYPYYRRGTDNYYVYYNMTGSGFDYYRIGTALGSTYPVWNFVVTQGLFNLPSSSYFNSGTTGTATVANVTASGEYTRLNNSKITISGNYDQSATSSKFLAASSLITVNGNGTFTADGTVAPTQYNGASLVLNGANTLTYNSLGPVVQNGFNNLTVAQNGSTTTLAGNWAYGVKNLLTVGSGTLTGKVLYLSSNNPLSVDASAHILTVMAFYGTGNSIPIPSCAGYGQLSVYNSGTVIQMGNIIATQLFLNADGSTGLSATWKTDGYNLTLGGSVTIGASSDSGRKTLDATSGATSTRNSTITVGGNWINYGNGTAPSQFIAASSTVVMTGTGASGAITSGSSTSAFYNLTINGTGGTYTLQDAASVAGNLNVTAGTLAIGANNLAVTGSSTITSTLTLGTASSTGWTTGDLNLGASGTITSNATTYYNQVTVSGTSNPDVSGTYTFSGTYNGRPYYRRGSDNWYVWYNNDTYLRYYITSAVGSRTGNIWSNGTQMSSPIIPGTYDPNNGATGNPVIANVTASGIYYGATSDVTISGNYTQTAGGYFNAGPSLITQNGNGTFTADGNNDATKSLQFNNASLVLNGANTLTYNNLSATYANGFNNLTCGQNGNTTITSGTFSIQSLVTIGSGTLTGGQIFLYGATPLSFDVASHLSSSYIWFTRYSTQTIPFLTNGYDSNIILNGTPVIQNSDITINPNKNLQILGGASSVSTYNTNGYNLTVGGLVQIGAGSDTGLKKLDATSGATSTRNSTITVGGNWTNYGSGSAPSQFVAASSTVIFNSTATGKTITSGTTNSPFNAVQFNGVGGAWTLQDNLTATSTTLTNGNLIDNAKTVTVNGNISVANTAGLLTSTGPWVQGASGNLSNPNTGNPFYALTIAGSGVTTTLTGNVNVGNSTIGGATTIGGITTAGKLTGNYNLNIAAAVNDALTVNNLTADSQISNLILGVRGGDRTQKAITVSNNLVAGDIRIATNAGYNLTATGNWNLGNNMVGFDSGATGLTHYTDMASYTLTAGVLQIGENLSPGYLKLGSSASHSISSITNDSGYSTCKLELGSSNLAISGNVDLTGITVTPGSSTFTFNGAGLQTLTTNNQSFYNLTHSGAGTLKLLANALTVTHDLTNSGGTLDSNGQTINVAGTWSNTASFLHGSSTVNFTGTDQGIFGTSTFYNLTKTVTSAATLTFEAAKTQIIAGVLTLQGALNQLLSLVSSVSGTAFSLNPLNISTLNFLSVQDFTNASSTPLILTNSRNISGTTNLIFGPTTVTWTGTTNTNWSVGTNWDVGYVPNATDNVIIANTANQPVLSTSTSANTITVNSGATLSVGTYNLAITGTSTINGTLTIGNSAGTGWTTTNLVIGANGTASSTANGTIYYNQVTVSGNSSPSANGTYTVAGIYNGTPYYSLGNNWYIWRRVSDNWMIGPSLDVPTTAGWYLSGSLVGSYFVYANPGFSGAPVVANVTSSGEYTRLNNSKITISGNFDQSTTTSKFLAASSIITINGNGTFTADGTVNSAQYNGASLVLNGANTVTYNNVSSNTSNGFNNLTGGQGGNTTNLYGATAFNFTVINSLTIGNGTIGGANALLYLLSANPLNVSSGSIINNYALVFYGTNQYIPAITIGSNLASVIVGGTNNTVTQTGDVVISNGNLQINGTGSNNRTDKWNTNGYNLNVGNNLEIGYTSNNGLQQLDATSDATSTRNSTITVKGNWLNYGTGAVKSKFIAASSTVVFIATSTTRTITNGSTTSPFYNLTINGSGSTFTLADNASVNGALTVTAGTLAIGTNDLAVTGSSTINGALTQGTSANTGWTTGDLNLGASGTITSNATTYYNQVTVSGTLSPDASGTYSIQAGTVNGFPYYKRSDSAYYVWNTSGRWVISSVVGNWLTVSSWIYSQPLLAPNGTYTPSGSPTPTGNATVANVTASGIYYGATSKVTLSGNYTQTAGGYFNAGPSLITVNGNGNFTADGNNDATKSQQFNNTSLVLNGINTLTYNHIYVGSLNGFNNLTVGQSTNTTTFVSDSNFSIRETLTVGTGTFYSTTNGNFYMYGNTPLIVDAASHISLPGGHYLYFYGASSTIPALANNGYDCSLAVRGTNATITQTGNIVINGSNTLTVGLSAISSVDTWKTDGYNLTAGGGLYIGTGSDTGRKTLDATSGSTSTRNSIITTGGNWLNYGNSADSANSSRFIAASSTVIFNSTATGKAITSGANASSYPFNAVQFNGVGGAWTLQDNLTATSTTLTNGNLIDNGKTVTVNGNISVANTANLLTSTGSWIQGVSGSISNPLSGNAFYSLTIAGSGVTTTLSADVRVGYNGGGYVTIGPGTLNGAYTLNIYPRANDVITVNNLNASSQIAGMFIRALNSGLTQKAMTLPNNFVTGTIRFRNDSNNLTASGDWNLGNNSVTVDSLVGTPILYTDMGSNSLTAGAITLGGSGGWNGYLKLGSSLTNSIASISAYDSSSNGNKLNLGTGSTAVSGNINFTGVTVTPNSSTINLTGTSTQTVISSGQSFYNLTHSGSGTMLLADSLVATGAFNHNAGALNPAGWNINTTGNFIIADGAQVTASGLNSSVYYNQVQVTGTLTPDATGVYTYAGMYNNAPYYRRGSDSYYISFSTNGRWYIGDTLIPQGTGIFWPSNTGIQYLNSTYGNHTGTTSGAPVVANVTAAGFIGSTFTIGGDFNVTGHSGALLALNPSNTWYLNVAGVATANYVNAAYSNASGGHSVTQVNSTDSGHNSNWVFDATAPSTTASATSGGSSYSFGTWTGSDVTVALSCADNVGGTGCAAGYPKYCVDTDNSCTPSTAYVAPLTISSAGETYIRYYSVDVAGNIESIQSRIIQIDKSNSIISNLAPATGATITKSGQTVTFTTDKSSTCRFATSPKSYDNMSGDYSCSVANSIQMSCALPNFNNYGTQDLYFACADALGNEDSAETATHVIYNIPTPPHSGGGGYVQIIFPTIPTLATPPAGPFKVKINDGALVTREKKVTLNLTTSPDTTAVIISTSPDFSNAVTLPIIPSLSGQTSLEYDLCQGSQSCLNKSYTIYTKFLSASGADSPAFSAQTYLNITSLADQVGGFTNQLSEGFSNLVGFFAPKPANVFSLPPIGVAVSSSTPLAFQGKWNLVPTPMSNFVFASLPSDFLAVAKKFPQVVGALSKVGITRMNGVEQLQVAKISLPGLAESAGLPVAQNVAVADFSRAELKKVPSNIIFARAGENNLDLNVKLSINNQGTAIQTVNTIQGHPLTLAIKPDHPAERVKGYLIFKTSKVADRGKASSSLEASPRTARASSLLASIANAMPDFAVGFVEAMDIKASSVPVSPETTPDLVLSSFDYKDSGNGIWTADVASPLVLGQYELRTEVDYVNKKDKPETVSMVVVVDPEGYVYRKLADGSEARITGAKVSIFWLPPSPKASARQGNPSYELWPATKFRQDNPQTTDVTGRYAFLVPPGEYYLTATVSGYGDYKSEIFKVEENKGVFMNIEMKAKFSLPALFNLQNILLAGILIVLVYFAVLFTWRRKRQI